MARDRGRGTTLQSEELLRESSETERLRAIRTSGLLDRSARGEMQDLVDLAARLTGSPMAAVTLIDADTQHFLCTYGTDLESLPRDVGFCSHTIRGLGPLVVRDASIDPRFCDDPIVLGPPHLRFYTGTPIHIGHLPVGTLCVSDVRARSVATEELDLLRVLARQVDRLIELHWRRGLSAPPAPETVQKLASSIHSFEDFDRLLGDLDQAAWIGDVASSRFLRVNQAAVERYGWSAEEFTQMTFLDLRPPTDAGMIRAAAENSGLIGEAGLDPSVLSFWNTRRFLHRRSSGELFEVRLSLADFLLEGRQARLVIVTDVTAASHLEAAVEYTATHDSLTGLGNRRLLNATLDSLLGGAIPVSLAFIDLDHFKTVNDSAGHLRGDELLVSAAARLVPALPADATAMRYGGDEFAVVMPRVPIEEAQRWADRARLALRQPYMLGGGEYRVTVSVGVAASEREMTAAELIGRADDAMYDAKRLGRNLVVVADAKSRERHLRRSRVAQDLAAADDRHELELFFQPIVELSGERAGLVDHVEALIRWHPNRSALVLPAKFLDVAEDMGLMGPIGRWVIREACAAAARWRASGRDLRVSVNCSVRQFCSQLTEDVAAALSANDLPGDHLLVEITESALTEDHEVAIEVIEGLGELGVQVVIDDFGTGYSSLGRLQELAVGGLKIDRTFVLGLSSPQGHGLYRAMVQMAEAFGLDVTAEGIETPRQLSAVVDLGCTHAQGHLLGRAGPEGVVPERAAFPVPGMAFG